MPSTYGILLASLNEPYRESLHSIVAVCTYVCTVLYSDVYAYDIIPTMCVTSL